MKKRTRKTGAYEHYKRDMRNLQRIGMVKSSAKTLTKEQFKKLRELGLSRMDIIQVQTRYNVRTTKEAREVSRALMEKQGYKFRKVGRGYQIYIEQVDPVTGAITTKKFAKGAANKEFMNMLHDTIAQRIDNGENREDVLRDYGYKS